MATPNGTYWDVKNFVSDLKASGQPVDITRFGIPRGYHDVPPRPLATTLAHTAVGPHGQTNAFGRTQHPPPASAAAHRTFHFGSSAISSKHPRAPPVGKWVPSDYGYHYANATSGGVGHSQRLFANTRTV